MLRLEKVNGKNVWDLLKLSVNESQREFVASNDVSIIEAYTTVTNSGYAFPFGIYEDDTLVGYHMNQTIRWQKIFMNLSDLKKPGMWTEKN